MENKTPCCFLLYLAHPCPACFIKSHKLVEEREPGPDSSGIEYGAYSAYRRIHRRLVGTIKEQSGVLRLQWHASVWMWAFLRVSESCQHPLSGSFRAGPRSWVWTRPCAQALDFPWVSIVTPSVLPADVSRHAVLLFFAMFHCQGQLEDKNQVDFVWCIWCYQPVPR